MRGSSLASLSDLNLWQIKCIRSWPALGLVSQKKAEDLERQAGERMNYGSPVRAAPAPAPAPAAEAPVPSSNASFEKQPKKATQAKRYLGRKSEWGDVVTADC